MTKKVFIIHGWYGYPEEAWFPWLKKELEKRNFEVKIPLMPNPAEPKIDEWVSFLKKQIKNPDKDTYFIGHSIGCQAILRYLETLSEDIKIGGAIFVAGWFTLTKEAIPTKEEQNIAKPWLQTTINFNKIKKHTNKFITIFSNNDPYVPIENQKMFKEKLNSKIIIGNNKGHFSGEDEIKELPIVLNSLLEIINN